LGDEDKTLDSFKNASELPLEDYGKAKMDLLEMLSQAGKIAKEYHGEGQGIKAYVFLGPFQAGFEIIPQPRASSYRRRPQQPKKVTKEQIESVLVNYQEYEWKINEKTDGWFVKAGVRIGDKWQEVNSNLRTIGLVYVRYDAKDQDNTGGWKGLK